ncbi:methyl-accepting chemotaxis protein [Azospirillum doebereinerae]|uniref:methyl-accepting chemotaxis protein n=1 Tax=Azospirillum doebereinerae TaxID=92933 RepID=UPI001EE5D55A|nr:methyl-accepting chemotaxis protein [Azospirillum doebereinerae]MCG5238279.1 methyl-accepting chemotaxis protein [Azospirillum doebereinerae]
MTTATPISPRSGFRFGVRAKLMLAFAGMAGMTVAASGVGLTSFSAVEAPLARIVGTSLPEMELATRLSGESGGIAAAAPTLNASESQEERARLDAQIMQRARGLLALVDELGGRRPNDPLLPEVREKAKALIATLETENAAVERRLSVRAQREEAMTALSKSYDTFLAALTPLVEGAGVTLRAKGDALDSGTDQEMGTLSDAVRALIALYELRGDIVTASDALGRAGAATSAAAVIQHQQSYLEASSHVAEAVGGLGERMSKETTEALDAFFRLGYGKDSVFDLRRAALEGAEGGRAADQRLADRLTDARARSTALLDQLQPPLRAVKSEIKRANFDVRSQIQDSMKDLLGDGLDRFRAFLELSAKGDAVIGALNEAAQAPDEERLKTLERRHAAAAMALTARLARVGRGAGEDDVSGLVKAAGALAAFGKGEASVFALRRAELAATEGSNGVLAENRALAQRFTETVDRQIAAMKAEAGAAAAGATVAIGNGRTMMILFALASLIGAAALAWFVAGRGIASRVSQLSDAMRAIAGGNLDARIPQAGSDEIGDMAQALIVFRDTATVAKEANARAEAERGRAAQERRRAMVEMAESFETSVRSVLERVSRAAGEMQDMAQSMTRNAQATTGEASSAAGTSQQAEGSVKAVAAATEELSASIQEIGSQVTASSQIARKAAEDAQRTDRTVEGLSTTANKIGEVVQLIHNIASQTNLLALNATIEAARAGEAGKGFAVVASEVKNLANQTGKATEEISAQITAMQSVTREAVEAIRSIAGTIGDINEIAATIAAAVEQQSAATREIARNVGEAADGTQHVRNSIDSVARSAVESGQSANRVLTASATVADEVRSLGSQVDTLVGRMRAG